MGTVRLYIECLIFGVGVVGGFGDVVLSILQLLLLFHHYKHMVILPMYRGSTIKHIFEKKKILKLRTRIE